MENDLEHRKKQAKEKIFGLVKQYYADFHQRPAFTPGESKIKYSGRVYDEKEILAATDAVLDFWLTLGPYGRELENSLAEFTGAKQAYLTNSGSSANLLAASALKEVGLKDGDEVITTASCFPTTFNPILKNNFVPVLVDVEVGTYNSTPEAIAAAVSPKTKAVFMAHTLGNPFDAVEVRKICDENGMLLLEDCCDALGSTLAGKHVGTFGFAGTLSCYPAHHITMGEGGAVFTADPRAGELVRILRDWGRGCYCKFDEKSMWGACGNRFGFKVDGVDYDHRYSYVKIGYNFKPTDIQAAIGAQQMKKLPAFIAARKRNFRVLYDELSPLDDKLILPRWLPQADPSWFAFTITIADEKISRRKLTEFLEVNKVETRTIFAGNIMRHPAYRLVNARVAGELKNSDAVLEKSFMVGIYPGSGEEEMKYAAGKIKEFLATA